MSFYNALGFQMMPFLHVLPQLCDLQMPPLEQEQIDEKEWWGRLEKLKIGHEEQEIVIKCNFGNGGAIVLENFARQLELHL